MENFKKVLIPTDGSEYNKEALQKGLSLAKLLGAEATILYVVDQSAFAAIPPDSMISDIYSVLQKEGNAVLDRAKVEAKNVGVEAKTLIREGMPAHEILEEAKNHDLIVMGTLGRTGIARIMMGSVAEKVVRHAPCPVMLIRIKHHD